MAIENNEAPGPNTPSAKTTWLLSSKRRLYQLGKNLYRAVPSGFRGKLYPIARQALLLKRLRPEVWILSGQERVSQLPLSVCLYSSTDQYKSYLQDLIFGSSFQSHYLGKTWLWKAFTTLPKAAGDCSILIAEVHQHHLNRMGPKAGIVIPAWIRGYALLPRGPEIMKRSGIKETLRKIKQQGLEYETSNDPEHLNYFYNRMYVPYSKARFGDTAFIHPWERAKAAFDRGALILVKKQNEYVSGQIVSYEGDGAHMPFIGVRDGDFQLVLDGALVASYEFALQHLEQGGYRRVDLGESQTFLNDGVLRSKKKYGHTLGGASIHKFLIRVLSDTSAARAFLQNNPFIFQHAGQFHGAVFLDATEPPVARTLNEVYKQHFHRGLSDLIAVFISENGVPSQHPINLELPPEIANDPSTPPQPQYQILTSAEYSPLIGSLGPIGIVTAIAIRPPKPD